MSDCHGNARNDSFSAPVRRKNFYRERSLRQVGFGKLLQAGHCEKQLPLIGPSFRGFRQVFRKP